MIDQPQGGIQRKAAVRFAGMMIVAPQGNRAKQAQDLAGTLAINPLSRLRWHCRRGELGQQVFQQTPTILQQGRAQGRFDPFGGKGLPLFQPLGKDA